MARKKKGKRAEEEEEELEEEEEEEEEEDEDEEDDATPRPRSNVYTGLTVFTTFALVAALVILIVDSEARSELPADKKLVDPPSPVITKVIGIKGK